MKKDMLFWLILGVSLLSLIALMILIYWDVQNMEEGPTTAKSEESPFEMNFIKASHSKVGSKNYMISPYSTEIALSMVREGSSDETKEELEKVVPERMIKDLSIKEKIEIANALFLKESVKQKVQKDYQNTLKTKYGAELIYDKMETPEKINSWVKEKTNGKIEKILDQIDPNFVLGIANAISFEEDWEIPFECENTTKETFTLSNGTTKEVSMMKNYYEEKVSYYKDQESEVAILPYKAYDTEGRKKEEKEQMEFIAIMPNNIDTYMSSFTQDTLKKIEENKRKASDTLEINVSIPKFKFDYDFKNFKQTLFDMGIQKIFQEEANLEKMVQGGEIYVNEAIHKTFIEVEEKGTSAAAVTYFGTRENAIATEEKEVISIVFDKPFLFLIKDTKSNEILFFGVVQEPSNWEANNCK